MYKPLTVEEVKRLWIAQNPRLVAALAADGRLPGRLEEAHEHASLVLADSIERGVDLDGALHLAMDAIGLPIELDDDDLGS